MHDLTGKAVWGGVAKLFGQVTALILRLCFLAVLARLLSPNDFGLVAMVSAVTGFFDLFTSAGLSSATIQKATITDQQVSQLFWINILVGLGLTLLCGASASSIAAFYKDQRLFWIAVAIAPGFLLNAAGVQHSALLQRELRYIALSAIEASSQLGSVIIGTSLALLGYGYWSLVFASIVYPAINSGGCWVATRWRPMPPHRRVEIRSMLRLGGIVTLNSIVVYIGYNMEKVLLGRFWGADALGLYTRGGQLINLPVASINSAVGGILFSALSRLQHDPIRFRSFFLNGYALIMAATIPATLFSALFADDIIAVVLGPNWAQVAIIFRLMTPTMLVFGIINPLYWVLLTVGLQKRSLQVGLVLAPLVMASYLLGLRYGPIGVAFCYSTAMVLWLFPHVAWSLRGTPISMTDLARTIVRPLVSGGVGSACAFELVRTLASDMPPAYRLFLGGVTMTAIYVWMLLVLMGQWKIYVTVLAALRRPSGLGV